MTQPMNLTCPQVDSSNLQNSKKNVLYKGPSGTGKTHNILSWPGKKAILYHDTNLETAREAIEKGDVTLLRADTLKQLHEITSAVRHRELDVQTVGIDTIDALAQFIMSEVEGAKGMNQNSWGVLKQELRKVVGTFTGSTLGDNAYFCACAVHVKDLTETIGTGENRTTKTVKSNQPAIDGGFKDELEGLFDNVLLTRSELMFEGGQSGPKVVTGSRYWCYTVAPTVKDTCKSKGLPAVIEGLYPVLEKAWNSGN